MLRVLLCVVLVFVQSSVCMYSNVSELCASYGSTRFPCINDCRCGACRDQCLPSSQNGKPAAGFSCDSKDWATNTPSLLCAIQDEAVGPILLALLSFLIATMLVILIIGLLLLCGRTCRYVTRDMSPAHVFNDSDT